MNMRVYKDTDEKVSLLGFGLMRLPRVAEDTQDVDYPAAQAMVEYALSNGINYFDTAYPYHEGKSETFIGHALKNHPRESFLLANKMPTWLVKSPEDVERIFQEQLEKCQVEYFDYYLVHSLTASSFEKAEVNQVYEILAKKKEEGKIRKLGFSFHDTTEVLEKIVDAHPWDFAQLQVNYLDWELQDAKGQYEIITKRGIPVIVMEPIRGGALATLSDKAVEVLKAADKDASPASWALRYVASLPGVLTVLSGMSNMDQMVDNIQTMSDFKPLTPEEYAVLDNALTEYRKSGTVPCTACRYCMDCPFGVDIPKVFANYNQYRLNGNKDFFIMANRLLGKEHQADCCTSCGQCIPLCPQGIQIPQRMQEIVQVLKD